jgi:guanylate kinase
MDQKDFYDHQIVNDDLERTKEELISLFASYQ